MLTLLAAAGDTFFGTVTAPPAIEVYGESGGLIKLGNNIIVLAVIAGGIFTLVNIIQAGYIYLTASGDSKAHEKVVSKITMSLWGMALMVMAPAIMAVIGFVFFKDSTFFLQPQITGIELTVPPSASPPTPPGPCVPGVWNNYICP